MPTYHVNATLTSEHLFRVTADDPRKAVEAIYQALYQPDTIKDMDEDIDVIQDENQQVEVLHVFDTDLVASRHDPMEDTTTYPEIAVDLTEPAQYQRFHAGL